MTGESGNIESGEASAYEQRLADDVARFLAGDDPFAEVDSDEEELPAPAAPPAAAEPAAPAPPVAAPAPREAAPAPPAPPPAPPAPPVAAELSTPAMHSAQYTTDDPGAAYPPKMEQDMQAVLEMTLAAHEPAFAMPELTFTTRPEQTVAVQEAMDFGMLPSQYSAYAESFQTAAAMGQAYHCTSPATFASVHSPSQPTPYTSPAAVSVNGRDMMQAGHLSRTSDNVQDPVVQAATAAIWAPVPSHLLLAAPSRTAKVPPPPPSEPAPQRSPAALPAQQNAATRERHMAAPGLHPPLRQQALAPGPLSVNSMPATLAAKQSTSGGDSAFSDSLLLQICMQGNGMSINRMDPFDRGQAVAKVLAHWALPCKAEELEPLHETIYSVILKLYADGIEPSVENVQHALLSNNCSKSLASSALQICMQLPQFYLIWSAESWKTYILLRNKPMEAARLPYQPGLLQHSQTYTQSWETENSVRRYTGVESHMTQLSAPVQSNPVSAQVDTNQIMASVAAAAASSTQPAVESSSGTYAIWDAYCPKCFEQWWQIPNYDAPAICRTCNAKLVEMPKDDGQGFEGDANGEYEEQDMAHFDTIDGSTYEGAEYAQEAEDESLAATHHSVAHATNDVHSDADMSDNAGADGKNSKCVGNSERIANIILEHGYTTLMIRNLSMRMRQKHLLKEIDSSGFDDKYDYCHLPVTFGKGSRTSGVGYAFVNFEEVQDAAQFVMVWHGQRRLGVSRSDMAITISHAEMQGKEANVVNWLRRGCHIRNPGLRPFIKGHCEALEEHERKKALGKPDPNAPPSLPPGLVLNPSMADPTNGNYESDGAASSLPPGLVMPMTNTVSPGVGSTEGLAFPDVRAALSAFAGSSSSTAAGTEPAGLEAQTNSRWPLSLDMMARIFTSQA